jgi:demethylmenaquinone methyltransferase/2-methoxy-6-polyprenyl-1,4-benzoquinol methylase
MDISRVTRSKEDAISSYNKLSKWYDILAGPSEKKFRDIGLGMLHAKTGETILEIGAGTGYSTNIIADAVGENGKVFGIDISPGMINVTKKRLEKAGLLNRVELICGDAVKLPFNSSFFDAVFTSFTLELFDTPEIPLVLSESNRVLKENGRLIIVSMSKKGNAGVMMKLYEWLHEKIPKYVDCRPIYLQEMIESIPFEIIEVIEKKMWGLPIEIVSSKKN